MSLIEGRALALSLVPGRPSTTSVKLFAARIANEPYRAPSQYTRYQTFFARLSLGFQEEQHLSRIFGKGLIKCRGERKQKTGLWIMCSSSARHSILLRVAAKWTSLCRQRWLGSMHRQSFRISGYPFSQYCETAVGDSGHPCMYGSCASVIAHCSSRSSI